MENNKIYIKDIIIESIITSVIGVIFYCILEACGNNFIVALCDATQNRLNMDLKVILIATYLVSFTNLWIKYNREKNLWTSMFLKVICSAVIYVCILSIFTYSNLITKFILMFITITISQVLEKVAFKFLKTSAILDDIFKYINIFLAIILFIYSIFR